jgi:hypothetical protein
VKREERREVFGEERRRTIGEGAPSLERAHIGEGAQAWRGRTMRLGRTKLEKGCT